MCLPNSRLALLGICTLMLSGCAEYFDHRDTLTRGVGDAVAHNRVVQTIDPWPRAANQKKLKTSGPRALNARERYIDGEVTPLEEQANEQGATQNQGR